MIEEIFAEQTTEPTYWNELHQVFAQTTDLSTDWNGDQMPRRIYGTLNGDSSTGMDDNQRKKMLHTQGIHAGVRFIPTEDSPYTGLYQGAEYGILRLSDAEFMLDEEYAEHQKYAQSVAIKFLMEGQHSENLMGMITTGLAGITNSYFFAEDQTNLPDQLENECVLNTIMKKFLQRTKWPFSCSAGKMASLNEDGSTVTETNVFPFEQRFVPNREVWPESEWDTSKSWLQNFEDWSNSYEPEQDEDGNDVYPVIFELWARDQPTDGDGKLFHIGDFQLTTPLVRSKFGDQNLFFRHQVWEYDIGVIRNHEDPDIAASVVNWRRRRPSLDTSVTAWPQDDDGYTIANIPQLPVDYDEAATLIQDDIASGNCPFAWILRANE